MKKILSILLLLLPLIAEDHIPKGDLPYSIKCNIGLNYSIPLKRDNFDNFGISYASGSSESYDLTNEYRFGINSPGYIYFDNFQSIDTNVKFGLVFGYGIGYSIVYTNNNPDKYNKYISFFRFGPQLGWYMYRNRDLFGNGSGLCLEFNLFMQIDGYDVLSKINLEEKKNHYNFPTYNIEMSIVYEWTYGKRYEKLRKKYLELDE